MNNNQQNEELFNNLNINNGNGNAGQINFGQNVIAGQINVGQNVIANQINFANANAKPMKTRSKGL